MKLLVPMLLAAGLALADGYEDELVFRLWGGHIRPSLFDARVAAYDENARLASEDWVGLLNADDLAGGAAAGAEVSWGFNPRARALVAFEGGGTSASAAFEGVGMWVVEDPYLGTLRQRMSRLDRYTRAGIEVGVTMLLADYDWCRFGLTGRAGVHRLSAAVERGNDWGPWGDHWWNRKLSGTAPGGLLGVEWEVPAPFPSLPFDLGAWVMAGYRVLEFRHVDYVYTDSAGVRDAGMARASDGTRFTLDFGGPELRFGAHLRFRDYAGD